MMKYSSLLLFAVLLVVAYFSIFNAAPEKGLQIDVSKGSSADYPRIDTSPGNCNASANAPVFFYLKTKAHVTYDAGHWFHMAEIFMASYSRLRATYAYANSSVVYFIFDDSKWYICRRRFVILLMTLSYLFYLLICREFRKISERNDKIYADGGNDRW
jgi:hypothetical protein